MVVRTRWPTSNVNGPNSPRPSANSPTDSTCHRVKQSAAERAEEVRNRPDLIAVAGGVVAAVLVLVLVRRRRRK
ncbi:hypothetical protein NJ76_09635 [Rhodococcus sp. IITR03]|nr:hypothetical protein NJ76_09635 [Rhodococcus sp. IITR03]